MSPAAPMRLGVIVFAVATLVVVVVGGVTTVSAAGPTLEVQVEPRRMGVEDYARLIVSVRDAQGDLSQPLLGELDNLQVVSGPSREQQFNWINGVSSSVVRFVYVVQPLGVGRATVAPITVMLAGKQLSSKPIEVEVVSGSLRALPQQRRLPANPFDPFPDIMGRRDLPEPQVVLRQLVGHRSLVLGEPVVVVVALDTTVAGIERFEWRTPPAYPGWWAQRIELPDPVTPEAVTVGGVPFQRYLVSRSVLIPIKLGELAIPSVAVRIGVRGRGVFAPLQAVERSTEPVEVEVRDRPPAPAGFSGAVGRLRYRAALSPDHIDLGGSSTLTISLEGSGNLPLVEAPVRWPTSPDVETYPPEEDQKLKVDERGIQGTRTWRTTVVPRRSGRIELAPVTLAVFDPAAGAYTSQTLGPLELEVTAPPATPTPIPPTVEEGAAPAAVSPTTAPEGSNRRAWVPIAVALAAGLLAGGLVTALLVRRRTGAVPPRRPGQSPADRARELQIVLERWWHAAGEKTDLRDDMDELRRALEAVRFAPGRADHSQTVEDLEQDLRRLMRRA